MDPALDSPLLMLLCIIIIILLLLLILSIPVDTKASQPVKAIYSSHTTATNCQQSLSLGWSFGLLLDSERSW